MLKRVFLVENRKNECHHWILHIWISLGTKFQLKLAILIFWTRFAKKVYLQPKKRKRWHHYWILHIRISRGTKFQLTILIFLTKFVQKEYFRLKTEESHLGVRPWSLLTILNFSARGPTDTTVFYCPFSF